MDDIEPENFDINPNDIESSGLKDDLREKVEQAYVDHAEKIEAFMAMLGKLSERENQNDIPWEDIVLVHEQRYHEDKYSIQERYWLEVDNDD